MLAILYTWLGPREMRAKARAVVAIAGAFLVVGFVFFVANLLVFTPMRLYTEELDKRTALEDTNEGLVNQVGGLTDSVSRLEDDNQDLRDKLADARAARPVELRATPGMLPRAEGFSVSQPRQIASPNDEYPYALELTLTVQADVQPFGAAIKCSQQVSGNFRIVGGGIQEMVHVGGIDDVFRFSFRSPAVTPRTPVVVTLISAQAFDVLSVERIPPVF